VFRADTQNGTKQMVKHTKFGLKLNFVSHNRRRKKAKAEREWGAEH
jgi:hypothetical protein